LVRVRVEGRRRRDKSGDEAKDKGKIKGKGRKEVKMGTWRVDFEVEVRVRKGVYKWWAVGVVV
jgi:hypothetical protein